MMCLQSSHIRRAFSSSGKSWNDRYIIRLTVLQGDLFNGIGPRMCQHHMHMLIRPGHDAHA